MNEFLTAKRDRVDSGELTLRSWSEYHAACEQVVLAFGIDHAVADLRPEEFAKLRSSVTKFIALTKTLFSYGFKVELLDRPVRFGESFDKPKRRLMRLERNSKAKRFISAADAWKLIDAAEPQIKAMILLGLNAGYGQKNASDLQRSALTADPGWIDAPRTKTGTVRRASLWPETVEALAEVAKSRPEAKAKEDSDCVFITVFGNRWVRCLNRGTEKRALSLDSVSDAFTKLCTKARVKVPGGPNLFRHVFRTIADQIRDTPTVLMLMGHTDQTVSQTYRERIDDSRLKVVTDHVRKWLLKGKPALEPAGSGV